MSKEKTRPQFHEIGKALDNEEAVLDAVRNAQRQHEEMTRMGDTPSLSELVERVAFLEHRLDYLYRHTVGDRTGHKYWLPGLAHKRGEEFPEPDYDHPGGPRRPQGAPQE